MKIQHIVLFFEAAALAAAFINFKKLRSNNLWPFLIAMPIVCMVEWGTNIFHLFKINGSAIWAYNYLVHPAELFCYSYVYYHYFNQKALRKRIMLLAILTAILMVVDALYLQGHKELHTHAYIFMCCVFVYFAYLYFNTVIYSDNDKKLKESAYFWISIGCLLLFSGQAPLFAISEYFTYESVHLKKPYPIFFSNVFMFLSNLLNYIMYTCLTIAFFCKNK